MGPPAQCSMLCLPHRLPRPGSTFGTPCTDWSLRGDGEGMNGRTRRPFKAWCGMRCDLQEECIAQENVTQFEVHELQKLLGHLYHIDSAVPRQEHGKRRGTFSHLSSSSLCFLVFPLKTPDHCGTLSFAHLQKIYGTNCCGRLLGLKAKQPALAHGRPLKSLLQLWRLPQRTKP